MNLSSPETALQELQTKIRLKKELDRRLVEARAINDFPYFVNHVFAASFDQFVGGAYIDQVSTFLGINKRTARVGARDHFKSTSLYARFMWHLFRTRTSNFEAHYFSYGQDMSGYHIEKIKKLIIPNPYYALCRDLKATADSVGAWTWDGEHTVTLDPKSLLSFKRGIHPEWIAVDDPFQDPENKLEPTTILKINDVFKKQILDMPKVGGELHVVGTAQTPQDFFFDATVMRRFSVSVEPAIVSEAKRIARWPEHMDFDELTERREERGHKVFAQEYLCSPVYTEDAWLEEEELQACVDPSLTNYNPFKLPEGVVFDGDITAGWDLGKKRHPSHLAVFETKDGASRQLHSKWMEGWDYTNRSGEYDPQHPTQVEYVKEALKAFGIDLLQYDATRGELDTLKDAKKLPDQFEGVVFTKKRMVSMATTLSDRVTHGSVRLLDDPRQTNQMLAVNNNLQAVESPQGHGDSFWSIAMGLKEQEQSQEAFVVLG
jgi:hypothetical protein